MRQTDNTPHQRGSTSTPAVEGTILVVDGSNWDSIQDFLTDLANKKRK